MEQIVNQNKQLLVEFSILKEEKNEEEELRKKLQKRINLLSGDTQEINLLTLDECEEIEKLLKHTMDVIENKKVNYILYCIFLFFIFSLSLSISFSLSFSLFLSLSLCLSFSY